MGRLEDKVALVTGAGRGIGKGIVEVLSREGAKVAVADVNFGNAARVATEVEQAGRRALAFELDVTRADAAAEVIKHVVDVFGGLDILVNNAGVLGDHGSRDITLEDWQTVLDVNLKSVWIMSRAVVPRFRERGGGKIVNIASIAGRHGGQLHPHYSASKAGVINLTQSLAMEMGPRNVNVNAVCPGLVRTDMMTNLEAMVADMQRRPRGGEGFVPGFIATNCPLRREQTPEDIGNAVAFLASEEARNITGQSLNVDGGLELN